MGWSTAPAAPTRKTGPAWKTTPTPSARTTGRGWFTQAFIEKVTTLTATGTFTANVATNYPYTTPGFAVGGSLTAVVKPKRTIAAAFTGTGSNESRIATVRYTTVNFTADTSSYGTSINDGLWAIVIGGAPVPEDGLSGIIGGGMFDGLSATISGSIAGAAPVTAAFAAAGSLTAIGTGSQMAEGWLTATITAATPPSGVSVTDDFNRADNGTTLGSGWTYRNGSGLGISGNAAVALGSGLWNICSNNTPMGSDDFEASVIWGSSPGGTDYSMVGGGFNSAGEGAFLFHSGGVFYLYSQTAWGTWTSQKTDSGTAATTGDKVTIRRVGNIYYGLLNNVVQTTWTDSGNIIPRDSSHRLVDFGIYYDGPAPGRTIDSFEASSAGGGTSVTATLSGSGTLSATVLRQQPMAAALAGSGSLTATMKPVVPMAAALSGVGALTATVTAAAPAGVTDDFNRADSGSLGSGWTSRANAMGIAGNAAYPTSTGAWCVASNNTTMGGDDMEASITLGTATSGNQYAMVGIGANSSGEMVFVDTATYSGHYEIYSVTDWGFGGLVLQANSAAGGWTTGDVLKLKRVGSTYTAYVNGTSVVTWTDSGNVVPRNSSHRLVAVGAYDDGSGHRRIDAFTAI